MPSGLAPLPRPIAPRTCWSFSVSVLDSGDTHIASSLTFPELVTRGSAWRAPPPAALSLLKCAAPLRLGPGSGVTSGTCFCFSRWRRPRNLKDRLPFVWRVPSSWSYSWSSVSQVKVFQTKLSMWRNSCSVVFSSSALCFLRVLFLLLELISCNLWCIPVI